MRFNLRDVLALPGRPNITATVIGRGECIVYGAHYRLSWIDSQGRHEHVFDEQDLAQAQPKAKEPR